MGITRERFLEKVEEIAATDIVYQEGKDGSNGACDCIGPVSYTHLDVYKRQATCGVLPLTIVYPNLRKIAMPRKIFP